MSIDFYLKIYFYIFIYTYVYLCLCICVLACVCRYLRRPEEGVGCPWAEVAEIVSSPAWGPRAELRSSGRAQCSASGLSLQPSWELFASLPAFVRKQISSAPASLQAGVCVFTTTWHVVPAPFCPSVLVVPLYAGESLGFAICKFSLTMFVFTYSMSSIYI